MSSTKLIVVQMGSAALAQSDILSAGNYKTNMTAHTKWRRFRPQHQGDLSDTTSFEPGSLYAKARVIIDESLQKTRDGRGTRGQMKRVNEAARLLAERNIEQPEYVLAQLILLTPGAASAQQQMDRHRGGYADYRARLFELIDFNDTFDRLALLLPDNEIEHFIERLYDEMVVFGSRMHLPVLSEKQYEAITHGLSREIALYHGVRSLGYNVRMTSRLQDAMGVDMVITDPDTKRSINIDCKTSSSFHFRLIELKKAHRLNEGQRLRCELTGVCKVTNGSGARGVETVLLRLDIDELGKLNTFNFRNLDLLREQITFALDTYGFYQ